MAKKNVALRRLNNFAPSCVALPRWSSIVTANTVNNAAAPSTRSQYVKACRASARSSRWITGPTFMAIPVQFDRASDGAARASRGDYRQKGHLSVEALKRWRVHALAANRSALPLQRFSVLTFQRLNDSTRVTVSRRASRA